MKAAWYEANGRARDVLRVGELPDPQPGPGEVRVRLYASGVNPSDVKTRAGTTRTIAYPRVVPHSDGAGIIDAVGPGVPQHRVGEHVWTFNAAWQRPCGTAAQYVALPSALAPRLPDRLAFAAGACLGVPYMTAHRAVFADGPVAGLTVLVAGGAGAVAHYAIQLAKWAGAEVLTTVSTEEKAAHARAAGADLVVNYRTEPVVDRVMQYTLGQGVDRVVEVEFGGNLALNQSIAKPAGIITAYGSTVREPVVPFLPLATRNLVVRFIHVYGMPESAKQHAIADLARWSASGKRMFTIAKSFPLEQIVEAHELVESGTKIGQVVVRPTEE